MQPPRSRARAFGLAGVVLVVLGASMWAAYLYLGSTEHHSFTAGATPPSRVQLRGGDTYRIGIRGGVHTEQRAGIDPDRLRCSIALPGATPAGLAITTEHADTKATDQIATFVAPYKGRASITCDGLGRVYVDNTESDPAGVVLVLAIILLTIGAPFMLLSGLRSLLAETGSRPAPSAAGGPV